MLVFTDRPAGRAATPLLEVCPAAAEMASSSTLDRRPRSCAGDGASSAGATIGVIREAACTAASSVVDTNASEYSIAARSMAARAAAGTVGSAAISDGAGGNGSCFGDALGSG